MSGLEFPMVGRLTSTTRIADLVSKSKVNHGGGGGRNKPGG